jgi:hypothetical protein
MATAGRALSQKALVGISPAFGNAGLASSPSCERAGQHRRGLFISCAPTLDPLVLLSGRAARPSLVQSRASESPPTAGACAGPANGRPVERSKQQSRRRRRSVPHRNDLGTLIDGRARFPFVAQAATRYALLLRPAADREQKLDLGLFPPATCPVVRETRSVALVALTLARRAKRASGHHAAGARIRGEGQVCARAARTSPSACWRATGQLIPRRSEVAA